MLRGFRGRPSLDLLSGGTLAEFLGLRVPSGETTDRDPLWWLTGDIPGEPTSDLEMAPLVQGLVQDPPLMPSAGGEETDGRPSTVPSILNFGLPQRKPPAPLQPGPFREFSEEYRMVDPVDLDIYDIEQRKLYEIESGGDPFTYREVPDEDNPNHIESFIGMGQFNQARLHDLGYYVDDPDLRDNKWTGRFIDLDGVYDYIDFMNNVAAQDEVYRGSMDHTTRYIEERGLDTYVGQMVRGLLMTPSAIRFGAHIGGESGMSRWLTTGYEGRDTDRRRITDHVRDGAAISRDELRAPGASSIGWERPMRPGEFFEPVPLPLPEGRL